jgi:hypothetical protein
MRSEPITLQYYSEFMTFLLANNSWVQSSPSQFPKEWPKQVTAMQYFTIRKSLYQIARNIKFHLLRKDLRMIWTFIAYFVLFFRSSKRQTSPTWKWLSCANFFHPLNNLLDFPFLTRHRTSHFLPWCWSVNIWSSNGRYSSAYFLDIS